MKNFKAVALVSALLLASSAFAAESADGHFYLGVGGGIDIPTQNINPVYQLAGAAEAQAGYAFSPEVAVQVQVDNQLDDAALSGVATSVYGLRPVAELKLSAPIGRFFALCFGRRRREHPVRFRGGSNQQQHQL
jgi:hypothetical protein